ncbi:allantoinase AllB [Paenibacillus chartarius]|uniref:Allantoinase n=1 Tax=Paenibacillus chartarius TaxID=747481 RepID=A0ABV6DH21_9BACL
MEALDAVIRGGTVVMPGEVAAADVGISSGKIAAIAERIIPQGTAEVIDAEGHLVMAGVVDMHVHFNEPNFGHWEGFASGSAALAAGGCTAYADMPLNGCPPTVNLAALQEKIRLAAGESAVDYAFWGGLVPGNLDRLEELASAGVIAFKAFMSNPGGVHEGRFREVDPDTLYAGMRRIAAFGGLLALHAESEPLTSRLAELSRARGHTDAAAFAASRPPEAELSAVEEALAMAADAGCRLHFVHISTPEAVERLAAAKRRGLDVSVETCPHYLTLTEEDMASLGPAAKCAPPLRSAGRRELLWERVLGGEIDLIASDHSPCPKEMKTAPGLTYFDAWGGIAGAQNSLELMLEEGWVKRGVPLPLLSKLLSSAPARRFGLYPRKGEIALGFDADIAIVNPRADYTLAERDLLHRHKHNPYIGKHFSCRVVRTLCRGRTVYMERLGIVQSGGGCLLKPGK